MNARADFDPGFFQFLIPTCLAQAQECIAEKSITDNRKASISGTYLESILLVIGLHMYWILTNVRFHFSESCHSNMRILWISFKCFDTW